MATGVNRPVIEAIKIGRRGGRFEIFDLERRLARRAGGYRPYWESRREWWLPACHVLSCGRCKVRVFIFWQPCRVICKGRVVCGGVWVLVRRLLVDFCVPLNGYVFWCFCSFLWACVLYPVWCIDWLAWESKWSDCASSVNWSSLVTDFCLTVWRWAITVVIDQAAV